MISKPHRLSTCHRHPTVPVTGFCASCLRERLAGFDSPSADESPELRRTKSCSGGRDAPSTAASEPRRRSCEVRARSSLSDLFNIDDHKKKRPNKSGNSRFEIAEEEEHGNGNVETVRVCDGREEVDEEEETKTMKEFIDLELQNRKNRGKDLRNFWHAASLFSEKLRKWKWKHKLKKKHATITGNGNGNGGVDLMRLEIEKPRARRLRETQSEVGEYGLGRRSCDTDGRISVDYGSRFSFDAPRASWDGYLIGNKPSHRLSPMVSVVEDEKHNVLIEENNNVDRSFGPGGSVQTKDYYSCRRSFDRSNSHRRKSISEVDELKLISNAKVSPATTELFYGAKLLITEKELMGHRNVNSLSDVQSDCASGSASKDDSDVANGAGQKWRRVWNKLGLVQRREDKLGEGECDKGDIVNKPLAESWQKLRRVVNVQPSESVSQKLIRSYSVSCRNPCRINNMGAPEVKGDVLNGRQEFMLQRNRSARYSPNNLDTGLLRFYLTPLKSYRRNKSGKSSLKDLHPIARNVL